MRLLCLLLLVALFSTDCWAASCPFCFGKLLPGTCACECSGKYLPPTCLFTALDDVTLTFTVNKSATSFSSELFQNAVELVTGGVQTYFVAARDVPSFHAMTVQLTMPGYTVQRVLASIAYGDPWTKQYAVIGAYPATPQQPSRGSSFDYILYQGNTVTISAMGVVWVGSALVLVLLVVFIDGSWLTNTTDEIGFSLLRGRRKKRVAPETLEDPRGDRYMTRTSDDRGNDGDSRAQLAGGSGRVSARH